MFNFRKPQLTPCNAVMQTYYPAGESEFRKWEHIFFTPVILEGNSIHREKQWDDGIQEVNWMKLEFLENGTAIVLDTKGTRSNYFCEKKISGKVVRLPIRVFHQDNPFFYISQHFMDARASVAKSCVIWEPLLEECLEDEETIDTCSKFL